jgi:hypothetical protein
MEARAVAGAWIVGLLAGRGGTRDGAGGAPRPGKSTAAAD